MSANLNLAVAHLGLVVDRLQSARLSVVVFVTELDKIEKLTSLDQLEPLEEVLDRLLSLIPEELRDAPGTLETKTMVTEKSPLLHGVFDAIERLVKRSGFQVDNSAWLQKLKQHGYQPKD